MHQVIDESVEQHQIIQQKISSFEVAFQQRVERSVFSHVQVEGTNQQSVLSAIDAKIKSILAKESISESDIRTIEQGLKFKAIATELQNFNSNGESHYVIDQINAQTETLNTQVIVEQIVQSNLSDFYSTDGEVSFSLAVSDKTKTLAVELSGQDNLATSESESEITRTLTFDLSEKQSAGNNLIDVFTSFSERLSTNSLTEISKGKVVVNSDNVNLGLPSEIDISTRVAEGVSDKDFRAHVLEKTINPELLRLNSQSILDPKQLDLESHIDNALNLFHKVGLSSEVTKELKSQLLADSDFSKLFDDNYNQIENLAFEGQKKLDELGDQNLALAEASNEINLAASLRLITNLKTRNSAAEVEEHRPLSSDVLNDKIASVPDSFVKTKLYNALKPVAQADDLFSFRNTEAYEGTVSSANALLGINGLISIGRTINNLKNNSDELSLTDKSLISTQVALGLAGITTAAAQSGAIIGEKVASKVATSLAETSETVSTAANTAVDATETAITAAKGAAKLAGTVGDVIPYVGLVIGVLATTFSIGNNIRSAVDAGKFGNSAQVGFYAGLAALDTVDLVVQTVGHIAEFIPIIGNVIGFVADIISLSIGIVSQFVGELVPDPNAAQNFDALTKSDVFTNFVDGLADKYTAEGFDVFNYETDATKQRVKNPYDDQ